MYLRKKGYPFSERNISEDPTANDELNRRGIRALPAFIIGKDVVVGFDRTEIESLIDFTIVDCPHCPTRLRLPKGKGSIKVTCPACKKDLELTT